MFLGIDLGTSNSAIVGVEQGEQRLFKTAEGMDVMPSAIMVDRRGGMFVGRKAYEQAAFSPQNVQKQFKRLMGTSNLLGFSGTDRSMTPEEASAEIIKALVGQVRRDVPDVAIDGAVVTIPAAFNQMQSEATMRAARLAGLERVALLQEPIAAAMAATAGSGNESGQFLVYDLGGGTFDAAIVQCTAGNVTIVAHAGVNMLGGLDFDRAIVNSIVRPWLIKTFDLPDNFQTQPKYERLVRLALQRAEMTKIGLSTQTSEHLFADENQIGVSDDSGKEIYLDVEVGRSDLEKLIVEKVEISIDVCRKLMTDSGYSYADLDRIVLIGGPSRIPYVRERVRFELGISLDTRTDPMTAVATGAAFYASGRKWVGDGASGARTARQVATTQSDLNVSFEYVDNLASSEIRLKVKVGAADIPVGTTLQVEAANGWTSGKLPLQPIVEIRNVPLPQIGPNDVQVKVFNSDGSFNGTASTSLTINRLAATADGMPLMHNLAVKIVAGAPGAERNVLFTLVKKGTTTPISGQAHFRASRDLRAGENASLVFELFQQADEVDDPSLNLALGSFEFRGDSLTPGQMIRKGDDVEIQWRIDASSLLHCDFIIGSVERIHSLDNLYVSTSSAVNFDGEDGFRLANSGIGNSRDELERLERALGTKITKEAESFRKRLDNLQTSLSTSHEADERRKVTEDTRLLRQDIYRQMHDPENASRLKQIEIDDFANNYTLHHARDISAEINTMIVRQLGASRDALLQNDLRESNESLAEAQALLREFTFKQPGFWIALFERLSDERFNAADKKLHDQLAARGSKALSTENIDELRATVFAMFRNTVSVGADVDTSLLSGLMLRN